MTTDKILKWFRRCGYEIFGYEFLRLSYCEECIFKSRLRSRIEDHRDRFQHGLSTDKNDYGRLERYRMEQLNRLAMREIRT